jgi:hypothetical protein
MTPEDFTAIIYEVGQGSPRAAAVVCGALLEDVLGRVLLAHAPLKPKQRKRLEGSGSPMPMSKRISIARACGLIDDGLEHDLSVITEIRNDFAHTPRPMAFEDQSIADQCARLRVLPDMKNVSPRMRYAMVVGQLLARLLRIIGPDAAL